MTSRRIGWGLALVLFIVLAAWPRPAPAHDTGGKIKVIVENAPLRVKPAMDSEVLAEGVPLGTVFNIGNKIGEWYEVQYQSKMGVMITGYIHEIYTEVVPAEAKAAPAATSKTVPPAASTYKLVRDTSHRVELSLGFGLGFGSFLPEMTGYSFNEGPIGIYQNITQAGSIGHKMKNPMGLGLSVSYYFGGGFGLKLRADMNFKQTLETAKSEYVLNWTQVIPPFGPNEETESWDVAGDMSLTTFSLDLVYKLDRTGMFQPYLNAGVSLFTGTANLSTTQGLGLTWAYAGTPYIDYFDVPLKIQGASLGSVGFNAGLGADIYFTPNIGLNLDAVYFLGKTLDLVWTPVPGRYAANLNPGWEVDATQESLQKISESLGALKLSTSFFKVMLGLKVGF